MNNTLKIPDNYKSVTEKLIKTAKDNNFVIYAVGGFVRDIILGRVPNDLDIMVEGENAGIKFSEIVAKTFHIHPPVTFEKFATSKLEIDGKEIEFIMPRKEYYDKNSRNPETEIGTLEQDALRRDFTVNALFLKLNDFELLDLTGKGLDDIKNKIIRVTDDTAADVIFEQDPLRILRAVRQSFQLDFSIEENTYLSMKNKAGRINIVSGERIRDELNKMLLLDKPSRAFNMLDDIGMLKIILPELTNTHNVGQPKKFHDKDVYGHTMDVMDKIKPDLSLRMAALLHDVGKPYTRGEKDGKISFIGHEIESVRLAKNALDRLKYSADFKNDIVSLIEKHMYPKSYNAGWKDRSVRKFADAMGEDLQKIEELNAADGISCNNKELFDRVRWLKKDGMLVPKEELLDGKELMEYFQKPAGIWIKHAKEHIRELQTVNPKITKIQALEELRKTLNNSEQKY